MPNHSVLLQVDRCRGCTACIKNCPAEAIRVRNRKAVILTDRCIDCGRCIQVCPHHAMHAVSDSFSLLERFSYNIALPEPALFGQFQRLDDVNVVLGALLKIGFDDVFEVGAAAELLSDNARRFRSHELPLPRITSACPTVMHIIQMRFPRLLPHVESVVLPMELAAQLARQTAVEKTGLKPEQIGVFAIVPCSSKITAAHSPMSLSAPVIDGAFAVNDIYLKLLGPMREVAEDPPSLSHTGSTGLSWGYCGGESAARAERNFVAVDGIRNVVQVLEAIEDGRLEDADFVELTACVQGCVGGCLNVENPYGSRMRLNHLADALPPRRNTLAFTPAARRLAAFQRELDPISIFQLDDDRQTAMEKMFQLEQLVHTLPGLDCASCGAPTCRALAEDVVQGQASLDDCIFRVRARIERSVSQDDAAFLPAPFRHSIKSIPETRGEPHDSLPDD